MTEILALLSTAISIAIQLNSSVEQIRYNRESNRFLVNRITSSLTQLRSESRRVTRTSPGLARSVNKLKTDLENALERCQKPTSRSGAISRIKDYIYKDSIAVALQDVERQISHCFQEFNALASMRIERKLGDHNVQVNRKLDQLLRKAPARTRRNSTESHRSGIPFPRTNSSDAETVSSHSTSKLPDLLRTHSKEVSVSLPTPARSASYTSTSSVASMSDQSYIRSAPSPPTRKSSSPSSLDTPARRGVPSLGTGDVRSAGSRIMARSESDILSVLARGINPSTPFSISQANSLDSECRRLRSLKRPSDALAVGRKAVVLRRQVHSVDNCTQTTAALAKSLTHVARSLKDMQVDSHLTGTRVRAELMAVLRESVDLYRLVFKEDKSCRMDLATALYDLSVRQSEPQNIGSPTSNAPLLFGIRGPSDLKAALKTAEEAVHHFSVLEREDPDAHAIDLAISLLNFSFILSDIGRHEKALAISRRAVVFAYRFTSTDPHSPERARNIRTLHKALMRVSYCLDSLGRTNEAQEAEMEANDVLKKPFFAVG